MLRIATLSAWAELAIASGTQGYLKDLIKPYRSSLASLWVASLRDYASVRADTEVLQEDTPTTLDVSYTNLGKEVLLPVRLHTFCVVCSFTGFQYYQTAWPVILEAIAAAMHDGDGCVLAAMDGIEFGVNGAPRSTSRKEPTAFFFVIFGLAYEALASPDTDSGPGHRKISVIALKCLKHLVRPQYSGHALLDQANFGELVNLFYRMTITEPPIVVVHILEVLSSLVVSQDTKLTELDALSVTG